MKTYENILVTKEDGITTVTIDRPKALNALNTPTLKELEDVFTVLAEDTETKTVIVTGSGTKAFVAGADLAAMAPMNPVEGREFSVLGHKVFDQIENLPQAVIAAVNGYALGGGCELAMACDIRIASETATFGQPEVNYGIIPGFGGTQRLARLIGKGLAKQYIFTGSMFDAQEAYRIGLVNVVTKPEELLATAQKMCKKIMTKGPLAITFAKDAINQGLNMDLESGLNYEAQEFGICFGTADQKEGMKAFAEKRKPVFQSK